MQLKFTFLAASVLLFGTTRAQDMNGFRADNYNGVNGAFFNPANLGNSPYKIDVSIFGMNIYAGNKNVDFSFNTFSEIGEDSAMLEKFIGVDKPNSAMANLALYLPSVLFSINKKTSIAILSRTRVLFDITDLDGKLINSINGDVGNAGASFSVANSTNMRMGINAFSEFGLSAGHVIYDKGNHFLKAGATVKYLGGIGNTYFQMNNLKTTINTDSNGQNTYATSTSGSIATGVGGLDISKLDDVKFDFQGSGFGADLGLVYEYRPESLSDNNNKYLFKVSAALLDIGSVNFTAIPQYTVGYNLSIPTGQKFYLDTLSGKEITELSNVFDAYPQYFSKTAGLNNAKYKVSLPTTLQVGGDFRATNNVYVSANAQISMSSNESKPYNSNSLNSITITPRFESKMLAAYLPIHYNNLAKASVGFGFRAGPLYAGSSSVISMALAKSKQVDFYFGFRVGIKNKNKKSE